MNSINCQICGRELTDKDSIARGTGPECGAKRASFLSTCGTSESEIETLKSDNDQTARWIRNFHQDMRAGRIRQAKQCIEIARRKVTPAPVATATEPPQPAIVVRQSERGYRVHPPYKHPQFVAAFKRTVSGRWYADSAEWFIPATSLQWAKELLEYWFSMPVYVEPVEQSAL